jgi:hypothetical protein
MIASFSRVLSEDLRHAMSDVEFDATLAKSIDEIYRASTIKVDAGLHGTRVMDEQDRLDSRARHGLIAR